MLLVWDVLLGVDMECFVLELKLGLLRLQDRNAIRARLCTIYR